MPTADRGPRRHEIDLPKLGTVPIYAGIRVGRALDEVQEDMTFYKGVRLAQLLEAVYEQGRKDGRAQVFEAVNKATAELQKRKDLAHAKVGRPRKK